MGSVVSACAIIKSLAIFRPVCETSMIYHDKVYGEEEIQEPALLDLFNSRALQRLKAINQYGTWYLVDPTLNTSRFDHSVGVMILLRRLDASPDEQIAGLIHDVGHAAFSHVIDYVFGSGVDQTYHERFTEKLVTSSDLPAILARHGYDWSALGDETKFPLLEQPIPDLCADRLDYFLRDALLVNQIDQDFVQRLLADLRIDHGRLILTDQALAKAAAEKFLVMGEIMWSNVKQTVLFHLLAKAIKIALDKGLIVENELFGTDDELWQKLKNSQDHEILAPINLINPSMTIELTDRDYDYHTFTKARYIDPLVETAAGLQRLTDLDQGFRQRLEEFIGERRGGYRVKVKSLKSKVDF